MKDQAVASPGHTGGPWSAHDDDGTGALPCVLRANGSGQSYVAQCNSFADARLIASAPELLSALVAMELALMAHIKEAAAIKGILPQEVCPCYLNEIQQARAAIAKARGGE